MKIACTGHQQYIGIRSPSLVFSNTNLKIHGPIAFVKTPETIKGSCTQASPKPRKTTSKPLGKFMTLDAPKPFFTSTAQYKWEKIPNTWFLLGAVKRKVKHMSNVLAFQALPFFLACMKILIGIGTGWQAAENKGKNHCFVQHQRDCRTADIHQGKLLSKNTQTF